MWCALGDTLYGIARAYGVSMDRLLQDNQLPDPSQLVVVAGHPGAVSRPHPCG